MPVFARAECAGFRLRQSFGCRMIWIAKRASVARYYFILKKCAHAGE
ncbi:hypothetical protein C7S17_4139 [Burkholderia thailandensis]|nr:hypothetical protein [Burkholderia thailandensis]